MFKIEYFCDACGKKMTDTNRCNAVIEFGNKSVELSELEICEECTEELINASAKVGIIDRRPKMIADLEKIKRLDNQSFTDAD